MPPPDYVHDEKRLTALEQYNILDTPAEAGFDDIVLLATQICETPVALVSLVAADRQWFKARIGFEPCETDLDSSVCAHALVEPDLLVTPDLTLDDRTRDNPLVTGAPFIRFYAGAPLRLPSGEVLGSLCVIDGEPRPRGLTETQASGLRNLARQVMTQLDLRRAVMERDEAIRLQQENQRRRMESEEQYRVLFEAIEDGFCIVEMKFEGEKPVDYRFVELNPAFAAQTGLRDAQGRWMCEIAPNHEQHWFDIYGEVALTGRAVRFEHFAGELGGRWYDVQAFRVGDPSLRRVAILFNDKTDRRAADTLRERAEDTQALVNQEISHRLKNVFAMVLAIATQTLRNVAERDAVEGFTQRLHALSTAHDELLKQNWAAAKLRDVTEAVLSNLAGAEKFEIDGPVVDLGPRATLSVSLLLHELATNAIKYGALSVETGHVCVRWDVSRKDEVEELSFSWAEIGGPAVVPSDRKGFGSKLIRMGLIGTGGVDLRYEPSGLKVIFTAPLEQVQLS